MPANHNDVGESSIMQLIIGANEEAVIKMVDGDSNGPAEDIPNISDKGSTKNLSRNSSHEHDHSETPEMSNMITAIKSKCSMSNSSTSKTCENCGQEMIKNTTKTGTAIDTNQIPSTSVSDFKKPASYHFCRICHCGTDIDDRLIAPCKCKGTINYVHHSCLQKWIKSSGYKHCELCGFRFVMDSRLKPIMKWQRLSMTKTERRKIGCSVFFHIVAITCVIWSLYVLIEKTASDLQNNGDVKLQWPFWTKLAVVAVGLSGGIAFMYVQCKTYLNLWSRWKAFNRIINVQNRPLLRSGTSSPTHKQVNTSGDESVTANSHAVEMVTITNENRSDQMITVNVS